MKEDYAELGGEMMNFAGVSWNSRQPVNEYVAGNLGQGGVGIL